MNTKSTEMNQNFDYPDCPEFTRHIKQMLVFTTIGSIGMVTLVLWAVANADAIDLFFQRVYRFLTL